MIATTIATTSRSYLSQLCCLVALLCLAAAGCVTTPSPTSPGTLSGKSAPDVKEGSATSPGMKIPEGSVSEGKVLLADIVKDLKRQATVDPVDAARVVEIMPDDPQSWYAAGLVSYRSGDMTTAMERLTRSAALDPVNGLTLMTLGEVALTMGDLTKADRYFSMAYEASPTPESANRLAILRIEGGYLESARNTLSGILESYPDDVMTRNNLAVAHDMMGETSKGISLLEGEKITHRTLLHTRALLELKEGQPEKAAADLESGFEDGGKAETWILLGATDLQKGEVASASDKFRKAIDTSPTSYEGYLNLGLSLRRQGLFADAEKTYLEGIASAPHPDLHLNLGILYELYRGDNIHALEHYRSYLEAGGGASARVEGWVKYLEGVISIQEPGAGSQ
jgi:tetratricopeptide (TPR) repeat protein